MDIHLLKKAHLSQGYVALFSGRILQFIGLWLVGLFIPVYLLQAYDGKIEYVIYYYIAGNVLYGALLPMSEHTLNKIGLRRSLKVSVFFSAFYMLCLNYIEMNVLVLSIISMISVVIFRLLFWLPYHVDMAKFTDKTNRGMGVSIMWATRSALSVLMPVISGLLLKYFGFGIVFYIAIVIYISSLIPYIKLPRTKERYSWGYFETWKHFFSKNNRKLVLANIANGAENTVGLIIWPIFIWQLFEGDYLKVGAVSSLIVLVSIVLQLVVGKYTDKFDKRKMIHWGSAFYAFGWIAKVFVLSPFHVFIVGAYHGFAGIFKDTPFDALVYELMADRGHFVDEYTALKEMAIQIGKVLMLVAVLIVATTFGLNWAFALAAFASLFINVL